MKIDEFYTKARAEQGVKMPLSTPEGNDTEEWLQLIGVDSPTFKRIELEKRKAIAEINKTHSGDARVDALAEIQTELVAALITGWSFSDDCTVENKIDFLTNAPHIENSINIFCGDRRLFFTMQKQQSESGAKEMLSSAKESAAASKPGDKRSKS